MDSLLDWLAWAAFGLPVWVVFFHIGRWARLRRVRRSRRPFCPACGYDLIGLSEARCPECGRRFTLEELWAAWVAAYVGADSHDEL